MAGFTVTKRKNSGSGFRRHGRNHLHVTAVSAGTDQLTDSDLIDLAAEFPDQPYPMGVKIYDIRGRCDGTITNLSLEYDFLTDLKVCDFISPNVENHFCFPGGLKSPTSELLDNGNTDWTASSGASAVSSSTIVENGSTYSQAITQTDAAAGIVARLADYSAVDCRDWDGASFYIRSTIAQPADNIIFAISEAGSLADTDKYIYVPFAMEANKWYYVKGYWTGATTNRNAIISHGIRSVAQLSAGTIYIDEIRLIKRAHKFDSRESGSINAGALSYGNLTVTTLGGVNLDVFNLDIEFEFIWSEDNIR